VHGDIGQRWVVTRTLTTPHSSGPSQPVPRPEAVTPQLYVAVVHLRLALRPVPTTTVPARTSARPGSLQLLIAHAPLNYGRLA